MSKKSYRGTWLAQSKEHVTLALGVLSVSPMLDIQRKIKSLKKLFFNIYLLLRDRESQRVSRAGVERRGDTESKVGSRF